MRGAAPRAGVALGVALCLTGSACRGGRWVIAGEWFRDETDAGSRLAPDASVEGCPTAATLDAQRRAANPAPSAEPSHAGLWRGSLEGNAASGFPGPELELRIDVDGQSSLRFGVPPEVPSTLDPTRGYLCNQDAASVSCATASGFVGGFVYPLEAVVSRGDVLSFQIVRSDPWDAWCRLQSPQAWRDSDQPCGYSFGAGPRGSDNIAASGCTRALADGTATPIDCELMYSLQRCQCAADTCVAASADVLQVGLELSDGRLVGSLWYVADVDAARVSFTRP